MEEDCLNVSFESDPYMQCIVQCSDGVRYNVCALGSSPVQMPHSRCHQTGHNAVLINE
jgi:hypothetical protein